MINLNIINLVTSFQIWIHCKHGTECKKMLKRPTIMCLQLKKAYLPQTTYVLFTFPWAMIYLQSHYAVNPSLTTFMHWPRLYTDHYVYLWSIYVFFGLNIFYSEEMDWVWHTTRQCPLQKSMYKRHDPSHNHTYTHCHNTMSSMWMNITYWSLPSICSFQ